MLWRRKERHRLRNMSSSLPLIASAVGFQRGAPCLPRQEWIGVADQARPILSLAAGSRGGFVEAHLSSGEEAW